MPAQTKALTLSDEDRRYLEQVRDSRTEEVRHVERARDGHPKSPLKPAPGL